MVLDCWRIDDEWWRRPIARMYYRVLLEDGSELELFRDLIEGGWYGQLY